MNIGIDLDNTIVCYDPVFLKLATEAGLPFPVAEKGKQAIREFYRSNNREKEWTIMQGRAYGSRMNSAEPYPGVLEFFEGAQSRNYNVNVVSHRTKHPYLGESHDLHAAAILWLEQHGLRGKVEVYLEQEIEGKAKRVGQLGCDVFIDDLPEFLGRSDFPKGTRKIHFDPTARGNALGIEKANSWVQIQNLLL